MIGLGDLGYTLDLYAKSESIYTYTINCGSPSKLVAWMSEAIIMLLEAAGLI